MKSVMRDNTHIGNISALPLQGSDRSAITAAGTDSNEMLSVNLRHQLGSFRLAMNFHVPPGLIVLLGASGAGKSLTLKSIAGLLHPQQGHIAVNGQILFDSASHINVPPQLRHIGYVPQHYALFPHLTIAENVLFALPPQPAHSRWLQWRKQRAARQKQVSELLSLLELDGLERRYPASLSGGQQQRVALARALAAQPRLLLLDEPFNALDAAVRERLRDTLKQFHRRFAIPIVLVTHDHAEAQQLADTIVVVQQGRVAQIGSVNDIFYSPRTPAVAQLVGQSNLFTASLATPSNSSHMQEGIPSIALRVAFHNPQSTASIGDNNNARYNWLPLPESYVSSDEPANPKEFSGCIRSDEITIHRLPTVTIPSFVPTWTPQGATQWLGILRESSLHGHMVRLLIHPCVTDPSLSTHSISESVIEAYLTRSQGRDIEVSPGEHLVLEIPPKAIHLFDKSAL